MLTLAMRLAPVPAFDRYSFAVRGREAALIASRGKRKMRCEIVPSCDLFSKDSAACPATRKEHFRRLTSARVQLPLSPPRPFLAGPVSEVPLVPHAPCVVPTRRHHALFVRGEAAVGGTPVVDTPWTIDFGNARTRIDHGQCGKGEQGEGGADHS